MGDHRPEIKITFEMHGHKATYDYGWRNWSPDSHPEEIAEWVREQAQIAIGNWRAKIDEADSEKRKAEKEQAERAELARLKAKYER